MEWGQLDLDKLVAHAPRYAVGATVKRLGLALDALGAPESATAQRDLECAAARVASPQVSDPQCDL